MSHARQQPRVIISCMESPTIKTDIVKIVAEFDVTEELAEQLQADATETGQSVGGLVGDLVRLLYKE